MAGRDTYHHGDLKNALREATVELVRERGARRAGGDTSRHGDWRNPPGEAPGDRSGDGGARGSGVREAPRGPAGSLPPPTATSPIATRCSPPRPSMPSPNWRPDSPLSP